MKNKKEMLLVISAILLTLFYFTYAVTITWDSAHYMSYVNILERILPFSSWDVVRGPVFPIVIYLSNLIFGKTVQGLLINSYIYYLLMLFFSYKILNEILPINKRKNKVILISIISIILNPIIYGYYHVLLTEFVAMTISVVSCYLAYKWLKCDYFSNKIKYLILTLIFCFLVIFSWFLKQPYISTGLFPLLIAFIISLFKKEKITKKLPSALTIFICIVGLAFSINYWNSILDKNGLNSESDRNPTSTLGNSLIGGLNCFELNFDNEYIELEESKYFSKTELKKIKKQLDNNDNTFVIINVKDKKDNIVDMQYIDTDSKNLSTIDSIKVVLKNLISHPFLIIDSYVSNYLSISDIYGTTNENSMNYESTNKIDLKYSNEISSIGMKPYSYTSNIFYITDEAYQRVVNYEQFNQAPKLLNYAMIILSKIAIILFKILFILLPISLVVSIIKRVKTKNEKYDLVIILFGFSFLHIMLHVITGAIIDRYAMPAYVPTFLGLILLINLFNKKEVKKNEQR